MYNHFRTLLLNRDGTELVPDWVICEQLVPVEYRKLVLPQYLLNLRNVLFGSNPDRSFQNYRLAQYLPLLHATDLKAYVTQPDSRITYLNAFNLLLDPSVFQPFVISPAGVAPLTISGEPASIDTIGKSYQQFVVTDLGGTVQVQQVAPTSQFQNLNYTTANGLTVESFALGTSGYTFRMPTGTPESVWHVEFHNRPQWDLGQIMATLGVIGEPTLIQLFGEKLVEPYQTFSNLFYQNNQLPYQLGAVLLAIGYRMNEIRNGS